MSYLGFPKRIIAYIRCGGCGGELHTTIQDEYIMAGVLCCNRCSNSYQIEDGIVRMLDVEKLPAIAKSEIIERDNEAIVYDKRLDSRYEREVVSTIGAMRKGSDLQGAKILEYGAGTGRLTLEFAKQADFIIATDFSLESLLVLRKKISGGCIGLVFADSTNFCTATNSFTHALAAQVFEHFPTDSMRDAFLKQCMDTLQPSGAFIASTYHYDLRMRIKNITRVGAHSGAIFYKFYSKKELLTLFKSYGLVIQMHPIDIILPGEIRFLKSEKQLGLISRKLEHIPGLRSFGHLLLSVVRKI